MYIIRSKRMSALMLGFVHMACYQSKRPVYLSLALTRNVVCKYKSVSFHVEL